MRVMTPVRLFALPALVYIRDLLPLHLSTHHTVSDALFCGRQRRPPKRVELMVVSSRRNGPLRLPLVHAASASPQRRIAHRPYVQPINGALATPLQSWLSLVESFNVIVTFSFVGSGLTAFWLALYVTRSYLGSLVAVSSSLSRTTTSRTPKVTCR